MRNKKHLTFVRIIASSLLIFSLFSCEKDDIEEDEPIVETPIDVIQEALTQDDELVLRDIASPNSKISEETAIDFVLDFFEQNKAVGNKSTCIRTVSKCEPLTRPTTTGNKSASIDTLAYVINFDNDMGYAVISADIRTDNEIVAFSNDGAINFNSDDSLSVFINQAISDCIDYCVALYENSKDSILQTLYDKTGIQSYYDLKRFASNLYGDSRDGANERRSNNSVNTNERSNTVPSNIICNNLINVEWGQEEPYNKYVTEYNYGVSSTPTGCVSTAIAQLMSYWKQPQALFLTENGKQNYLYLDWNKILTYINYCQIKYNEDAVNQIAKLMKYIGRNINTSYGDDNSLAYLVDGVKYLKSLGYTTGTELEYTAQRVVNSIDNKCPVLIHGSSTENKKLFGLIKKYGGGHTWIIDGYVAIKRRSNNYRSTAIVNDYYFHANWGWDGKNNGYYADGVFDTNARYVLNTNNDLKRERGSGNHYIKYNLRIFTNIKWGK